MKKIKKVLAVLLTLAMVMAMSLSVFATVGTSKVVITGAEDATIKYAQLVREKRESVLGWEFVDQTVADAFIAAFTPEGEDSITADDAIAELIELGKVPNINGYAIQGTVNTDANFGEALTALKAYPTASATNAEFVPTEIGLYMITASKTGTTYIPMAVYVGTDFEGVTVKAKGASDQISKLVADDGKSVSEGDKVTYTVTVQYPFYSADAENPKFKITDTLNNATFEEDYNLLVKEGSNTVSGYTATVSENKDQLTIDFTYDAQYAGKTITITYVATVGEVASTKPLSNNVKSEIETGSTVSKVVSDSVDFKVIKKDSQNDTILLAGADFTLYVASDAADAIELKGIDASGEAVTYKVEVVETKTTVATTGEAIFTGLDAQKTYYVKETKAPEGYSLNDQIFVLSGATANAPSTSNETDTNGTTTITTTYTFEDFTTQSVLDSKLSALPSTGGMGTTLFTIGGCIIMILAAALFFVNRRRSAE